LAKGTGMWPATDPTGCPVGWHVRPADDTFATKTEAEQWLTLKEDELLEGEWIDPDAGAVLVADYVETWIGERAGLRPKTIKIYRGLLRCHIAPHLATVTIGEMTLARVRRCQSVSVPRPMRSAGWQPPNSPSPTRPSHLARERHASRMRPVALLAPPRPQPGE
jgi:hypothetical protein